MRRIIALLLALLLSGCTGTPGTGDKDGDNIPLTQTTDRITLAMRPPDTLHPLYTKQNSNMTIYGLIFDSLVNVDSTLRPTPYLAESCSFSDDKTVISFKLKSGIVWHDGKPFTAGDVQYTFSKIKNPDEPCIYTERLNIVERITVVDELHFSIKLASPYVNILNLLDFPIIPAHVQDLNANPVGTGQYKFLEYQPKKIMRLARNDSWVVGTPPQIPYIDVKITATDEDESSGLKIGEISAVRVNTIKLGEFGLTENIKTQRLRTLKYEFLGLNMGNPALSSPRVRQAMSHALNRAGMLNDIYFGSGCVANAPVPPFGWFYNSETDKPVFDAERARTLLAEDGWEDKNGDGVLEKSTDGKLLALKFTILVNEDNAARIRNAERIVQSLKNVGIRAVINQVSFENYEKAISEGRYDMFLGGFEFSPSLDFAFAFSSGGGKNYMGYNSPDMDAAISNLYSAVSDEEAKKAYLEFQYLFARDMPVLGLFFLDDVLVYTSGLIVAENPSFSNIFKNINKWEFKNEN